MLWALKGLDYFQRWTKELYDFPEVVHVPMERVMSDGDYFASLLMIMTGRLAAMEPTYLATVYEGRRQFNGRMHPSNRNKPSPTPAEAFASWPAWLQDMVRQEVARLDVERLHAPFGYDFSFMT